MRRDVENDGELLTRKPFVGQLAPNHLHHDQMHHCRWQQQQQQQQDAIATT